MDQNVFIRTKKFFTGIAILFSTLSLSAQDHQFISTGIEIQQYPTGFLLGGRAEFGLTGRQSLDVRIGYNFVDHGDQGVHLNEEGGGIGATVGYRFYFKPEHYRFFIGARTDLWFNKIKWKDSPADFGTTKIIVLQPTLITGYVFKIGEHWGVAPTLAFGAEINIVEKGEPVGEGAILLWGLNADYRF